MKRLLAAFFIAFGLHAALFFVKFTDPQMVLPTPLEFKKIKVSLANIEAPVPEANHSPTEKPPTEVNDQSTSKEKKVAQVKPPAPNPIQNTVKPLKPVQEKKSIKKQEKKDPTPDVVIQKKEVIKTSQQLVEKTAKKTQKDSPEQNTSTPARSSVAGNVIQEAVPLQHYNNPPPYPRAARRRGIEGLVEINVLVDIQGKAKKLHIHVSSGHRILDKAAIKAIRKWHFTPGRQNGKIMEMWVKVPVRFQLIVDKINDN